MSRLSVTNPGRRGQFHTSPTYVVATQTDVLGPTTSDSGSRRYDSGRHHPPLPGPGAARLGLAGGLLVEPVGLGLLSGPPQRTVSQVAVEKKIVLDLIQ